MKNINNGNIFETFLLGSFIYFGLSNIDMCVTVNVTDKPILTAVDKVQSIQNIKRGIVTDD